MARDIHLIAGTRTSFATDLDTPVYTEIEGITTVGAVGLTAESKDATTLKDTSKQYGRGIFDAPDKTVKGQLIESDADQTAFIDACKAGTPMMIKIEWPNIPQGGTNGTIAEFEFVPLGFELDEGTAEDWMMFTSNGKQNSINWTKAV